MASQSFGSRPSGLAAPWYSPSASCNRSYLIAALRAAVIAVVLLGVLALIVLF